MGFVIGNTGVHAAKSEYLSCIAVIRKVFTLASISALMNGNDHIEKAIYSRYIAMLYRRSDWPLPIAPKSPYFYS